MNLLKRLLLEGSNLTRPSRPLSEDPSTDPDVIRALDEYGREVFVAREDWRTSVLLGNLETRWNAPDQLSNLIVGALVDGFQADVLPAAEQLHRIDPMPERGACLYGIVLLENGRLDDAERVLRGFLAEHGEDAAILTNLAKVHAARHDDQGAENILWHALEVDPSGAENTLLWYAAICRDRAGEQAWQEALRRVAALPGSWRAQLWLARHALQAGDLPAALSLYQESLARVPRPVPDDVLWQISGDLGIAGHSAEALDLVEPLFDARQHGLDVGNNLIKAHLDLGHFEAARLIVEELYALQRSDWAQPLSFWDSQIAQARTAAAPPIDPDASMAVTLLGFDSPVWVRPSLPAVDLLPTKAPDAPSIAFLGSTVDKASSGARVQRERADASGRLSRALPLFLAEQTTFHTTARALTLVPRLMDPSPGFIVSGSTWTDDQAARYAQSGELDSAYIVVSHLTTGTDPWTVDVRLIRATDSTRLARLRVSFPSDHPEQAIPDLARRLLDLIVEHTQVPAQPPPAFYQVPTEADFPYYLVRLEQLLAVRCTTPNDDTLSGERAILDGTLDLCLNCPDNVAARILLAQTLLSMNEIRPDIPPEYQQKIAKLEREHPLPEPAHSIARQMFAQALG